MALMGEVSQCNVMSELFVMVKLLFNIITCYTSLYELKVSISLMLSCCNVEKS